MITDSYPFGKGEVYLDRELDFFLKKFDTIILAPVNQADSIRELPQNVLLDDVFLNRSNTVNNKFFIKHFFFILSVFYNELIHTKSKMYVLKNFKKIAGELCQSLELSEEFYKKIEKNVDVNYSFYSVWMNSGSLLMSILKYQNKIDKFSIRLHGYDLYDERRAGGFMPFRYFNFQQAENIFIVSNAGKVYLEKLNLFNKKLKVNYSGVYDNGVNKINNNAKFHIISCSNIIPLKRVNRIYECLLELNFDIKWTHIGAGELLTDLQETIKNAPSNLEINLLGFLSFEEIMKCYKTTKIDLFIHLSETEGLPLSIVEVMSFGIPALAANVGGISEIINDRCGFLVDKDFKNKDVVDIIIDLNKNPSTIIELKKEARRQYLTLFNADKNYTEFVASFIDED